MIGDLRTDSSRRRGFTLVELLVVIGIIVILIALLLPMIVKATRQGQKARIASDLNAISSALEAYKQDFGDYPRIIYQPVPPNYNGTGSGAAVLGKALMGLGEADATMVSDVYVPTSTYVAGQIASYAFSGVSYDFEATQAVPVSTPPTEPANAYWAPIPLSTAADGADGPGFRIRGTSGRVYGPYLAPDKFKTRGLAIVDSFDNPILYYPANPAKPTVSVDGTAPPATGTFGMTGVGGTGGKSNYYVGVPPGVTPNLAPTPPTSLCQSFYNYSDNDTVALNMAASATDFIPTFPDISVMEAMLGDYNFNGFIDNGETAASTAPFLLWSAGPDGQYGPVNSNTNAINYFVALPPTAVKNLVIKCDDVTNFSFGQ